MQSPPLQLAPERISRLADTGLIVDLRPPAAFAGGHVPGSVSLAPGGSWREGDGDRADFPPRARALFALARTLGSWDGALESEESPEGNPAPGANKHRLDLYLLSANLPLAHRIAARLTEVTELGVAGILPASALAAWAAGGGRMRTIGRITPAELADRRAVESVEIVDAGEIETLLPRHAELDPDGTVVVAESVGDPEPVAATTTASILLALGHRGQVLVLESRGQSGGGSPPA